APFVEKRRYCTEPLPDGLNIDHHHNIWYESTVVNPYFYSLKSRFAYFRTGPKYVATLEKGSNTTPPIASQTLDDYLKSHLIDPTLLRADKFEVFMYDRQKRLLALIERAMGKSAYTGDIAEEAEDVEADEDMAEAELTMAA